MIEKSKRIQLKDALIRGFKGGKIAILDNFSVFDSKNYKKVKDKGHD